MYFSCFRGFFFVNSGFKEVKLKHHIINTRGIGGIPVVSLILYWIKE